MTAHGETLQNHLDRIIKLEARVLELEREAAVREAVEVEKEIQAMEDNL